MGWGESATAVGRRWDSDDEERSGKVPDCRTKGRAQIRAC